MSNLLCLRNRTCRLCSLGRLLLLLLPKKRRVLMWTGCSSHAIRNAWLSIRQRSRCSATCRCIHGRLTLLHHRAREMLCCQLSGLLRRQARVFSQEVSLKLGELRADIVRKLRLRPSLRLAW